MKVHEILYPRRISEAVLQSWDISGSNDISEMIDIIERSYSQAISAAKKGNIIYRGFKDGLPYAINEIDFTHGSRSSRDTNNVYQLMMIASKGFKDYPSRSKSFICTSDKKYAAEYGGKHGAFVILPRDDTKIAVLNYYDMFGSVVKTHMFGDMNIIALSQVVRDSLVSIGIDANFGQMSDPSSLDSKLQVFSPTAFFLAFERQAKHSVKKALIDPMGFTDKTTRAQYNGFEKPADKSDVISAIEMNEEGLTHEGAELLEYFNKNKNSLFSAISSLLLNPETMGTQLVNVGQHIDIERECWFTGQCIAVSEEILRKILELDITESVNTKLFYEGYEKTKLILGDQFQLVAKAGYVKYGAKPSYRSDQFRIEVWTYKNNKRVSMIGWVNFENIEDDLQALDLSVNDKYRRRGIATEMYIFAKELGNTIAPSPKQTGMGKLFWNKDHS